MPGGRYYTTSWFDAVGNFWTFGGWDNNSQYGDLWRLGSLIPLPLRQILLRGSNRNSDNVLYWETTGEEHVHRFIVERSTGGKEYTAVATVAAVGTGDNRYSFTDHAFGNTAFFYRIQVIDQDGQTYYSKVITLDGTADARISVYPNPAHNAVTLALIDNGLLNTTVKIYTTTGQLAGEALITNLQQQIDLQRFPKGVLTLRFNNGKTVTFIKE